jgi:beta-lactamase regulating signal transducer with metallopeptidase domain
MTIYKIIILVCFVGIMILFAMAVCEWRKAALRVKELEKEKRILDDELYKKHIQLITIRKRTKNDEIHTNTITRLDNDGLLVDEHKPDG